MNELVLIERIDKQLQQRRKETVFPLSPTHRKELRILKKQNIGNLRSQLRTIKDIKKKEYLKKYIKDIQKEFTNKQKTCDILNKDWINVLKQINKVISNRRDLEKKHDLTNLQLSHGWNVIAELKTEIDKNRKYTFNLSNASEEIADKEFDKAYGSKFLTVDKKIEDLTTKYEEAINFGDLEIVKELYYYMKKADKLFESISKIEV